VRACTLAQDEVALGGQLRIRVDRDAPGDPELAGKVARRRHTRARLQGAVADRAAELVLDLRAQRAVAVAADRQEQLDRLTGLVQARRTGSSVCTSGP
jgi:hypothetical protein